MIHFWGKFKIAIGALTTFIIGSTSLAANCDPAAIQSKIQLWKEGACLRGANMYQQQKYATITNVWDPVIKQQDLLDLRQASANLVNYSVPGPYDVQTYQRRDDFFRKLDEIVNYAQSADLFIVLSFRTGPGRGEGNITGDGLSNTELYTNAAAQTAFANMWKEVATRYKDRKHIVGYDLLVEPNGSTLSAWRAIAQKSIDAIRSVDANTPILVSPNDWGVVSSLSNWTPLVGTHLLYTVHQYEPYNYTHNNRTADWSTTLNNMYSQIAAWMTKYGQTIVVNEFGISNTTTNAGAFMQRQIELLEQKKLAHAAWIWEVEYDPNYTYEKFDFKENASIYSAIQAAWRLNQAYPSRIGTATPPPVTTTTLPSPPPTTTTTTTTLPPTSGQMACGTPTMSAVAGKPTLYIWRDCNTNNYGVQVFGNGTSTALTFSGRITVTSPNQINILSRISLESNDVLSQTNAQTVSYSLRVNNNGTDGFKVSSSAGAVACILVTLPTGGQILAGPNKVAVTNSSIGISLSTLGSCSGATPSPPTTTTTLPLPPPTTTTLPPTSSGSIPMTALEWKTEYDGFGSVVYDSTNQSVVLAPMASTSAGETHAALLLSKRHLTQPLRNFRITVVATTEKQLRTPTPNAWECFWLFFNYTYDSNGKKITNYFTMKPNGIELGRAHDELGQNFLSTASSPLLQIGLPNKYVIEKIGGRLQVWIDGRLVMTYDSATGPYPLYDHLGTVGLYTEDARVRVHSVSVEPL